ncbi:MAG TPA: Fur family transcriptional regulator [Dermatophilaceae bacterium]|nr:Fur family transcriptional regulator [Dermatophilaceae bacterium]
MTPTREPAALLREASLRVTRPRVAVLEQLERNPHADVETVAAAVRSELGKVSTQAIYDVLHALTVAGLVRRIEPAGSPTRYELRVGDNHHHLVCRSCGAIADVECAVGERPCLHASDDHGYLIDEAEVTYWGLCTACRPEPSTPPTSTTATPPLGEN